MLMNQNVNNDVTKDSPVLLNVSIHSLEQISKITEMKLVILFNKMASNTLTQQTHIIPVQLCFKY